MQQDIAPQGAAPQGAANLAMMRSIVAQLHGLWEDALGVRPADDRADFFALGGDSLKAVCLMAECGERFGLDLPLTLLFDHPTPAGLGAAIERAGRMGAAAPARLTELKRGDGRPPLLLVHPVGGAVACYRDLAACLPEEQPVLALRVSGLEANETLAGSLEEMADEYLGLASGTIESGCYHLAGWSFGGLVAFEMARRAALRGRAPLSLTLIDTPHGSWGHSPDDYGALARAVAAALGLAAPDMTPPPKTQKEVAERILAGMAERGNEMEEFIRRTIAVVRNAGELRRRYTIRPYDRDATLIVATQANAMGAVDAAEWQRSIVGRLRVEHLPASHDAIVAPPFVTDVARIMNGAIGQAARGGA